MLDRDACERRVYRLAALLTGNPVAATGVIAQVVDAQSDLSRLDGAHMDRLTVLRSREIPPATLVSDLVPQGVSAALSALTPQQREAYVFARVYQTPLRETSRAMDCSVTAIERHIQSANEGMRQALDEEATTAPRTLLAYSRTLDVPTFYRAARLRRRRMRRAVIVAIVVFVAAILAALAIWRWRPFDDRPPQRAQAFTTSDVRYSMTVTDPSRARGAV